MTLTEEQIAEIRARAEAATPGPWERTDGHIWIDTRELVCCGRGQYECCGEPDVQGGQELVAQSDPVNADFIAHARTDIPALLSALESARSANRPRDDYPVFCSDCGRAHVLDTVLPSEIWNKIASPDDLLCVVCIDTRLKKAGLTAEAEFYYSGDALRSRLYGDADALEAANKRAEAEAAREAMREDRDSQQRVCIAVMTERDTLRARVAVMQEALEIIAGKRQCLDNLMGNKDVALAALTSEGVKDA